MAIVAVARWFLTGLIAIFGVNAGATIWFYREPVVDTVPDPGSHFVAATAGFLVLLLSLGVSIGVTVHATRCNAGRRRDPSDCHCRRSSSTGTPGVTL